MGHNGGIRKYYLRNWKVLGIVGKRFNGLQLSLLITIGYGDLSWRARQQSTIVDNIVWNILIDYISQE